MKNTEDLKYFGGLSFVIVIGLFRDSRQDGPNKVGKPTYFDSIVFYYMDLASCLAPIFQEMENLFGITA